jgi:putative transposase
MHGPEAVSEQALSEKAMDSLPAQSLVMGDRNFGVLWVVYAARQRGLDVVLRLTDVRAHKLKPTISQTGDWPVVWEASRWDGGKQQRLPAGASVPGRLIAARVGVGKSQQWLYLFTTSQRDAKDLVELYGRRWNIETDLRSLKRTVRLHHIAAKSDDMMEKEILMAVSAYNLIRAVMGLAARKHALVPRQLSFTTVMNVVNCGWPKVMAARPGLAQQRAFALLLKLAAQSRLPQRSKRRSYPRYLWRRPPGFGFRKEDN